jgi:hypothetical protein
MLLDTFPLIELQAQATLREAGFNAGSSVPARPTYPLVTIRRIGGLPAVKQRLDRASIQVDVWGQNKTQALGQAHAARVTLLGMEGQTFSKASGDAIDAYVTAVEDELGLTFLEDHVTGKDRYLFGLSIYSHSA